MSLRVWSTPAMRALLVGAGTVVMVACGSDTAPVTAPEPVAVPAPAEGGGAVRASADTALAGVPVASCDFVNPTAYSLSLTGNSSASTSGNETLQCRGSVAPAPSSLEFYSGFPCYLPQTQDWTSNSQLTLRTNGTASLTCKGK